MAGTVNAAGKDWARMHHFMGGDPNGDVLETDQETFDSKHRLLIEVYGMFLFLFALKIGYMDKEAKMARNLGLSGFNQLVFIEGNLLQMMSQLASGRADTLFMNSIIHMIIYYMAYIAWFRERNLEVDRNVKERMHAQFVGDDTLAKVFEMPGFDNFYIRDFCKSLGYKVTSATKGADLTRYVKLKDATFLKRRFLGEGDRVYAPLSLKSIYKSLCYRLESKATDSEHLASVLLCAQREFFLHGRTAFDEFQSVLRENGYVWALLEYDDLLKAFDEDRLSTWNVLGDLEL
jgi:hypothetical protein